MMVYRRDAGEVLNLTSLLFVAFAVALAVFSIFYADWYSAKITGFASPPPIPPAPEVPSPSSSSGPPQYVVNQVADDAGSVSQSADYASNIETIITGDGTGIGEVVSEEDLIRYKEKIDGVLSDSISIYDGSSKIVSKYRSKELDEYSISIVQDIDAIRKVLDNIDAILTNQVAERHELQREEAIRVLAVQMEVVTSVERLENYVSEITPSDVEGEVVLEKCEYPTELASFDDAVNFGESGIDANGEICNVPEIEVYRPISISTSGGQEPNTPVTPRPSTGSSGGSTRSRLITAFHIGRGEGSESANEAVVISRDKDNNLKINFINSPSFHGLEKEISDFIDKLLFGIEDINVAELLGMSVQEADSIIESNKSVPWVLWIVLFTMIVLFLLFGKFLTLDYKKMISSGKNALDRKNYSKAIKIYNDLVGLYSLEDIDNSGIYNIISPEFSNKTISNKSRVNHEIVYNRIIRQDILDYLILLKKKIGEDKISLSLPEGSGLPKIDSISSIHSLTNDSSRVEKMIIDSLRDITDLPKVAVVRMPVIVEAYKNLDSKSREKLAPLYESLIYKMRDLY